LVVVLVLGAAISGYSAGYYGNRTVSTVTSTSTVTGDSSTRTVTSSVLLHEVIFQQTNICVRPFYVPNWSVNLTSVSAFNRTTTSNSSDHYQEYRNDTLHTITFSVPDGTYSFAAAPLYYFDPQTGTVTVRGSDNVVKLAFHPASCGPRVGTFASPGQSTVKVGTTLSFAVTVWDWGSLVLNGTVAWSDDGAGGSFSSPTCALSPSGTCSVTYTAPTLSQSSCQNVKITAIFLGDSPPHSMESGTAMVNVCPT
jgi:hypothetical protein